MTSEKLASMEPWTFRSSFPDSWLSEAIVRDTEMLTKALHKSLSTSRTLTASDSISPFVINPQTTLSPAVSNVSRSDADTTPKRHRNAIPVVTNAAKVSKRKSRASKRTQTTFITADPVNFRQMVQQVTGSRFGGAGYLPVATIVKPEPQRPGGSRLPSDAAGFLPTLDTSAFLLDHQQQSLAVSGSGSGPAVGPESLCSFQSSLVGLAGHDDGDGDGIDIDDGFPTLESWKVM